MSYVSNIADSILSHSGGLAFLGPEVYTAIAEWEKREIPAAVVLDAIDEVFQYCDANRTDQVSLEAFQAAVSMNFRAWLSGSRQKMAA